MANNSWNKKTINLEKVQHWWWTVNTDLYVLYVLIYKIHRLSQFCYLIFLQIPRFLYRLNYKSLC